MVDRIRNVLARFPENEAAVRQLIRENQAFGALCQEYANTDGELGRLAHAEDAEIVAKAHVLRNRRTAIEEEILTVIEGHNPV